MDTAVGPGGPDKPHWFPKSQLVVSISGGHHGTANSGPMVAMFATCLPRKLDTVYVVNQLRFLLVVR